MGMAAWTVLGILAFGWFKARGDVTTPGVTIAAGSFIGVIGLVVVRLLALFWLDAGMHRGSPAR